MDEEPEDFTMHNALLRHAEEHLAKAKDEADRAGWQEVVDHLNTAEAVFVSH